MSDELITEVDEIINPFHFFAINKSNSSDSDEFFNQIISSEANDNDEINKVTYDDFSDNEKKEVVKKPKDFGPHAAEFKKIAFKEYYRFVIDGKLQLKDKHESFGNYSSRQHGAVAALLNAFSYAIAPQTDKGLSVDIIKKVHQLASKPPKYPSFCSSDFRRNPTGFELHKTGGYDSNLTEQGFRELFAQLNNSRVIKVFDGSTREMYIAELLKEPSELLPEDADAAWKRLKTAMEKDELICYFALNANDVEPSLQAICDLYNTQIQQEDLSDEDKIRIIVTSLQQIEQVHPFEDGNCRTCYVLLQKLLLENDLLPAILHDPNRFDGYSIEELVNDVKDGIKHTRTLLENPETEIYGYSTWTKEEYINRGLEFKLRSPEWHYDETFKAAENLARTIQQMTIVVQEDIELLSPRRGL